MVRVARVSIAIFTAAALAVICAWAGLGGLPTFLPR
jgi:hypothetical protein